MLVPAGIALDSSGSLFVADQGNNRVLSFPFGSIVASKVYGQNSFNSRVNNVGGPRTAGTLNQPVAVAVDTNGRVYVADRDNYRVLVFP
jgi:sugar lactone lactonase YvrE